MPSPRVSLLSTAARGLALALALLQAQAGRAAAPEHLLLEVPIAGTDDVRRLAEAGFDVAGVNRQAMTAGVVATPGEMDRLRAMGVAFARTRSGRPLAGRPEALSDYSSPDELSAFMDQVQAAYPTLARKVVLRDDLFERHVLYAMEITKDVGQPHDRPAFLLDAQHHAREVMTAEIARDAIDYLTSRYGSDARVTEWVDSIDIWVVACVNPDGAAYVFTDDDMWRKNRHPACAVDLNRNYAFDWDACNGSSGACSSEIYRGTAPASEPETQGMTALMAAVRPLYALSYHSYGEYILSPYGCADSAERATFDDVGQALNGILEDDGGVTGRYATGPSWSTIYVTDGSSDGEEYGRFGAFTFTIEVNCCDFQPDYATWRDVTVQRQRTAWQFFLDRTLHGPGIVGHVTDAATGAPLPARVSLAEVSFTRGEAPRTADAAGRYGWVVQAGRTYHVTYSLAGYASQTYEVPVGTGPQTVDVALVSSSAPGAPQDPAPADGATGQPLAPTLRWSASGATSYEVHLGATADPPLAAEVPAPSYEPGMLQPGALYYWRVTAVGDHGRTDGPLWSFATETYTITAARTVADPFRVVVDGARFAPDCVVEVNGTPVPRTVVKGSSRLVAKGGSALRALLPRGTPVTLTVRDGAGRTSGPFPFTR